MDSKAAFPHAVHPVILSGGLGARLWPLSRTQYPKQFMPLTSELTMLQETARRAADAGRFAPPIVVCNEAHRFVVAEQFRQIGVAPRAVVLEPDRRNTAPAAAVAALLLVRDDADALALVMPSDHAIGNVAAFLVAVETAIPAARAGALVTFGVAPQAPETGYGYIRCGAALAGAPGCYRVAGFVEKPDREAAGRLLAGGDCLWNSGMFLFAAARYLEELARFEPDMVRSCRAAVAGGTDDLDFFRLAGDAFRAAPAKSIDHAVMERTDRAAVVPAAMGWSDVGSWSSLWETGARDADGNVLVGDTSVLGVRDSYVRADGRLVAVVGLNGVIVVATDDAVLVVARDRAQEVRAIVDALDAAGRPESAVHSRVYRPWGHYQDIAAGAGFRVKRITVNPGGRLSLQKHRRRAEHWVVVRGTAAVTRGEETFALGENQSTFIPLGAVHRLANPGDEPLHLIEVQCGEYLGEDDIVRLEDQYGRAGEAG